MMRLAWIMTMLAVASLTSTAFAQEDPQTVVRRGIELRRQGEDQQALELFRRAWEASHRPIALGQLALAEQAVGRWVTAEAHLREAMQEHADDDWVRRHRVELDDAYSVIQRHVGQLEVHVNVAGAHVAVNGTDVGVAPLPAAVYVEAGTAAVLVSANTYDSVRRDVHVPAGQLTRETVDLQRTPSALDVAAPARRVGWHAVPGAIVLMSVGVACVGAGSITSGAGIATWATEPSMTDYNVGVVTVDALFIVGIATATVGVIWQVVSGRSETVVGSRSNPWNAF